MNFIKKNFLIVNLYYKIQEFLLRYKLKKIKKIKLSKKNKNIFIFGNGSSLSKINFNKIKNYQKKNYDLMVMNNFFATKKSRKLKPNYWITTDNRIANPNKKEFNKKKFYNKYAHSLFTIKYLKKLNCEILLPHNIEISSLENRIIYFNGHINKYSKNIYDITKARNLFFITGITAISIAHYMGYKKIYICGLDNDQWLTAKVKESNNIIFKSSYFYEHPRTYHAGKDVYEYLNKLNSIYLSYRKLKNKNIINLDPNSTITYFNKKHKLDVY
jgi:hypothetical protein